MPENCGIFFLFDATSWFDQQTIRGIRRARSVNDGRTILPCSNIDPVMRALILFTMGFVPQLFSWLIIQGYLMEKKKSKSPGASGGRDRERAATHDILSPPSKPVKISPKWERHYRRLADLREFFLKQRGTLTKDANEEIPSFSEHMADAGTDSYDRDFALGMLSSDQDALYEIDQAIRRIETGSYGICELTGKPISMERLNAIPWTRFTLGAEKQLEQRGAVNRARLGDLGTVTGSGEEEEEPEEESGDQGRP